MYTKKREEKGKKMNAEEQHKQSVTGFFVLSLQCR
jgi:hypothetical protein